MNLPVPRLIVQLRSRGWDAASSPEPGLRGAEAPAREETWSGGAWLEFPGRAHLAHLPTGACTVGGAGGGDGGFAPAAGAVEGYLPAPAGGGRVSSSAGEAQDKNRKADWEEDGEAAESAGPETAYHVPVLEREVVEALVPEPGKLILDGTLGGGGHTRAFLLAGANVLAVDQDPEALSWANRRLADFSDHLITLRSNFASFPQILEEAGLGPVLDGILLDLGVSSHQLDTAERGFSFMRDGPLDMRMDPDGPQTAADLVNTLPEEELARIFFDYGDEKASRRVARAIVRRREQRLFGTTGDLSAVVASVIPKRGHASPATRVFQSLRIAVNREMEVLETALASAHRWLKPGGRLTVITFHSLEDRIVKQFFRRHSQEEIDRPEWPAPRPNPECYYRLLTRRGVTATQAETVRNPRARSATLRAVERRGGG